MDSEAFDRVAATLLDRVVRRGLFHKSALISMYLALVAGLAALCVLTATIGWPIRLPCWAAALIGIAAAAIALLRGTIVNLQFSRIFFRSSGGDTRLSGITSSVEHIFCATDLTSSAPFYFSTRNGGYLYSPALGFSTQCAHDIKLSTAVRSSAAFPGGIPPKKIKLGDVFYTFRLNTQVAIWQTENTQYRKAGDYRPKVLFLADGGVWNNLGTQAILEHSLFRGAEDPGFGAPAGSLPFCLIVANASAPVRAARLWRLSIPLVAELASLSRSINTVTSNTVIPRIEQLRRMGHCAVVSITDVWDRALGWGASAVEYKAAHPEDADLAGLPDDYELQHWPAMRLFGKVTHEGLARSASGVRTTLGRIDRETAVDLMMHAYQNAQAELFFVLGYPRVEPRPWQDRFYRLVPATPWEIKVDRFVSKFFDWLDERARRRDARRREEFRKRMW